MQKRPYVGEAGRALATMRAKVKAWQAEANPPPKKPLRDAQTRQVEEYDMTMSSLPMGEVTHPVTPLPDSYDVRETAFWHGYKDHQYSQSNAQRPLGRREYRPLPKGEPAKRVQLSGPFCHRIENPHQLSLSRDPEYAYWYQAGVDASRTRSIISEFEPPHPESEAGMKARTDDKCALFRYANAFDLKKKKYNGDV